MKFIDKYKKIQKMGNTMLPYHVWTFFKTETVRPELEVTGKEITLGGDYKSLEEARAAIQWLTNELGGTIKWEKDK